MVMSNKTAFEVRGIETHSRHMWEWEHVKRMIDFARENDLNALVFHENDLIDQVVYAERFISRAMMKRKFPVYQYGTDNNCDYIRKVAQTAKEQGIDFYLEVKELWFRTYVLFSYPELLHNGIPCPNDPFWWDFLQAKLETLYQKIPEVSGIIVSIATKESRLSIINSRCHCEKCRHTSADQWFQKIIDTMYQPTKAAGKKLIIRDFAWSPKDLDDVVSAVENSPSDVVISLKATPHDYYPNFPDNPRIGNVGNHPQWIEYDVWGQFYGWGVFPCNVLEDIKKRMEYDLSKGATGFIARTDWELVSEGTAFDGLNKLNLYGMAKLSRNIHADFDDIYHEWLTHPVSTAFSESDVPIYPGSGKDQHKLNIAKIRAILEQTCDVMVHGTYVNGHVFNFASAFQEDLDTAWFMMEENHSLADWDASKKSGLDLNPDNIQTILAEKELALEKIKILYQQLQNDGNAMGLNPIFYKDLLKTFEMYVIYIEGFLHTTRACFMTKYYMADQNEILKKKAREAIASLAAYAERLKRLVYRTEVHHYVYMLLDHLRLESLISDLNSKLDS